MRQRRTEVSVAAWSFICAIAGIVALTVTAEIRRLNAETAKTKIALTESTERWRAISEASARLRGADSTDAEPANPEEVER